MHLSTCPLLALAATISLLLPITAAAAASTPHLQITDLPGGKSCTIYPRGTNLSDVATILSAVDECGTNGRLIFPENQTYYIASRLNPVLSNVTIEWRGTWLLSPDIPYWQNRSNTYFITYQNHAAAIVFTGHGITIEGHGTGGVHGNGDVWYTYDAGTTTPGRPMPFVFWNVSDVTVKDFFVREPPFWSAFVMNANDIVFDNLECNATATKAPYGDNWVQNTDGFDTVNVTNLRLTNFVYQGGDDCIAVKDQSHNIFVQNAVCHGGNGMAIGSLGMYLDDASVDNVIMDNVTVVNHNDDLLDSAYIKTWVGIPLPQSSYESAGVPRGGGWGSVTNILFSNFLVLGANAGPVITQDNGDNGSYPGTSKLAISNVAFVNFTGYLDGHEPQAKSSQVSCSNVHPCYNIAFENVTLLVDQNSTEIGGLTCDYVVPGGVYGLNGTGC